MDNWHSQIPEEMKIKNKFMELTIYKGKYVASCTIQNTAREIIVFAHGSAPSELVRNDNIIA